MKVAFVIPVYNRAENLRLVLHALLLQTDRDFQVIVADDGSTDNPAAVVSEFTGKLDVEMYSQEHAGYRVSKVRNMGVSHIRKPYTHIWFIDSDVVLNCYAVEEARRLIEVAANIVIVGRYDWMPPMQITCSDLSERWGSFLAGDLPRLPGQDDKYTGGHPVIGHRRHLDVRQNIKWDTGRITLCTGATLSGNLIVPREAFEAVGGFDENIEGQGQDCDFGKMLGRAGIEMTFSGIIGGYHLYHYRDLEFCAVSVKKTIAYMGEKFR